METRITAAVWCTVPLGLVHSRSSARPSGPTTSGTVSRIVRTLRRAVALALDRLGVDAERDVVDERAPVDLGEVDDVLAGARAERVERAEVVVAVDAEVEREVVAGPGRDARVRQVVRRGDPRDDRLRPVTAGHREPVRAARDRVLDENVEVVAAARASRPRSRARARRPPRPVRSARPSPERGLTKSTGADGGSARGSGTRTA